MRDRGATRGYRVVLSEDPEDESWAAEVPDLPGCIAAGATPAEALELIGDAIGAWIETAGALGRQVPAPTSPAAGHSGRFVLRVPRGLHARLARSAEDDGVSLNTWCATALAEAVGERGAGAGVSSDAAPHPGPAARSRPSAARAAPRPRA